MLPTSGSWRTTMSAVRSTLRFKVSLREKVGEMRLMSPLRLACVFYGQGIYYAGIGTEEIVTPEDTKIQFFDLYVINKTAYVPNNALRNGKRANEVGDFGVINLADNQECEFEYTFVDRTAGPLSLLHTFRRPLTGC
eukprot:667807-Pleurochrysis_carterae.AAC.8